MAAGDVVGKDLQLRLVVGLRLVGEQERPCHHLGVGLLRVRPYDDAALEYRMGAVVDDSTGQQQQTDVDYKGGVGVTVWSDDAAGNSDDVMARLFDSTGNWTGSAYDGVTGLIASGRKSDRGWAVGESQCRPHFVKIRALSDPSCRTARPTSSSECPCPYVGAVSTQFTPAATAWTSASSEVLSRSASPS